MLSPGGLVTLVMMFIVGQLSSRIQPKYLIMTGAIFVAISMYQLTNVYGDVDFWFLARTRMALGVGLPLIFIPIIAASYDWNPGKQGGHGVGADQRGAQHGRLDWRLDGLERAHASRAVPPEPADRAR